MDKLEDVKMSNMTQETEILILKKAKSKKDGCYRFRGIAYRVKGCIVTHFAYDNMVIQRGYCINCIIGRYITLSRFDLDKKGQKILMRI